MHTPFFGILQDEGEDGIVMFHFWEVYEGNAALGRHNTTPEVDLFMKKIQGLVDGPVGMALYEIKNGKLGTVSVQGGPRGEGGLDDATGATGAAGGASYKQTSGVVDLSKHLYIYLIYLHLMVLCVLFSSFSFNRAVALKKVRLMDCGN